MTTTTYPNNAQNILNDYALEQIEFRARTIGRQQGLSQDDIDDLQQDLALAVLELGDRFEPDTASHATFISSALDWVIQKRVRDDEQEPLDIDDLDEEEEPVTNDPRNGEMSFFDGINQAIDIADIIESMPSELREVCTLLKNHSVSEVCDHLGIGYAKLHRQMARIQRIFLESWA